MFAISIFETAIFLHIIDPGTTTPAHDWKTFGMPIIVSVSVVFFFFVAGIAMKKLFSGRCRPHEAIPLMHGEDGHSSGHNSAGGDEEYFSAPSTMTSVQDEPLSMTNPAVASKNNNTNKEIQGPVRKDSHKTDEAKV